MLYLPLYVVPTKFMDLHVLADMHKNWGSFLSPSFWRKHAADVSYPRYKYTDSTRCGPLDREKLSLK